MRVLAAPMASGSPRQVDLLFDKYGESHRHRTNKLIHWICVPSITWTVLALLWALHPVAALLFVGLSLAYYLRLSPPLAAGMALLSFLMLGLCVVVPALAKVAVAVFVVSWVGQFIGHKVEGKKPSFFEDLHYLLIGPLWLMAAAYRRMGWRY